MDTVLDERWRIGEAPNDNDEWTRLARLAAGADLAFAWSPLTNKGLTIGNECPTEVKDFGRNFARAGPKEMHCLCERLILRHALAI